MDPVRLKILCVENPDGNYLRRCQGRAALGSRAWRKPHWDVFGVSQEWKGREERRVMILRCYMG